MELISGDLGSGLAPFPCAQGVRELLRGQHAGVGDAPLADLGNRGVRDPGFDGQNLMESLGFGESAGHIADEGFVCGLHGTHDSHMWLENQYPPVDYPSPDNLGMKNVREHAANTLACLMKATPSLDTLQKVAAKSGVGYGTVRRVKNADVSVTAENLAAIAAAFKLSLVEFLEDFDLTPVERECRSAAKLLADLPEDERARIVSYLIMRSEMLAIAPPQQALSIESDRKIPTKISRLK